MTLPPTTRASLLFRLRDAHDHEAWVDFVSLYEPVVYRLLRRQGLQDADARDVMQELFLAVSRSIDGWDPAKERGSFRGWLRRVARNLVINWLKQPQRRATATGGSDLQAMLDRLPDSTGPAMVEFDQELRRALFQRAAEQVRGEVQPATWQAFWETAVVGTSPADAADKLGMLHRHLEVCQECSTALECMAGGPAWCREAASLLVEDELDAVLPLREDWSEVDFTVEHLEPADEPNVLGRLGGYDVLEIIGRGGMGVVLKGFDRELNRLVAIKVLAPHLAHSSLAKQRFAREAQAAAAVVHPHVLAIHQVQPNGRLPFLVMPLVAGESLAARLAAQGTLELKEILRIGMQAAAGLAAAHEQGLVHRDVKPANILLEKGVERAVLTDFGLARAADDVTLTRWGIIAGTPQYMSPEQARGEPLDGRSDLFSLGCVLYEMATGVSPFRADSVMATLRRLVDDSPQSMASLSPELPRWFIGIVDRLLEKDPSRRFNSAREVSQWLEGCLAHVQQPAVVPLPASVLPRSKGSHFFAISRRSLGVIAMIAAFGVSLLGMIFWQATTPPDIAGRWLGEEWGAVVLDAKPPGQYEGSYTDSDNARSGTVHLKWSRVERRFNGTWREGDDRHGKISLRLVGDQIRGAWTTDETPYIKPGTPGLADLLWVRETDSRMALDARPATAASSRKPLTSVDEVEAHIRKLIEDRKSLQNIYADFTARHAGGNTDSWSHYQIWLHGDKERADRKGVVGDAGHTEIFTADFSLRVDRRSGHSQYASRLTRGSVCGIPDLRRFGIVPWWVDTIRNHDPELTLLHPRRKNMTVEIGHHQGQPISIVKFDVTNDQGHDSWHEYWLSPTQGNLPIRISGGDKAKTGVISQTNCWEQFDGVWFPRRMDFKCQNAGQPDKESVVEVKQARFNMSPFPDVFTPDGSILQKD